MIRFGKISALSLFLGLALVYLFHIFPPLDSRRILPQVLSITEQGKLSINDYLTSYGTHFDLSQKDGYAYPGQAPGLVFLSVPLYAFFRSLPPLSSAPLFPGFPRAEVALAMMPVIFLLISLPTLLTALLLHRYAEEHGLTAQQAATVATLYSIGSPAFSYAVYFGLGYHGLSNLAALFAFLEVTRAQISKRPRRLASVGLALGILPFLWYPGGMISIILGAVLLGRESRGAIRYALPAFLVPVAALLLYHWAAFGHPLSLPYFHRIYPESVRIEGMFLGSTLPSARVAWKLLVGIRRGLLFSTPVIVFAFFSARKLFSAGEGRPALDLRLAWLIFVLYFVWSASRPLYWGGGTRGIFGPRYLVPALPFLFVMLVHTLPRVPPSWLTFLGAVSVFMNLTGTHYRKASDIDAVARFLTRGPRFPVLDFLNSIPEPSRVRFPDLFPASHAGFAISFFVILAAYLWLVYLTIGTQKSSRPRAPAAATEGDPAEEATPPP